MLDVVPFLERHFQVDYSGEEARVDCPFCESRGRPPDTKQHLYVNISKPVCHCFRCGYGSTWQGLVIDYLGVSYPRALGELYRVPNPAKIAEIFRKEDAEERLLAYKLPQDFQLVSQARTKLGKAARKYLVGRGIRVNMADRYSLGVADSIGWRVIIPIERNYWQARALSSTARQKYINPSVSSTDVIFNSKALQKYQEIVVCEGAFSAMAVGDNAIALIGKEPNSDKIHRMIESPADHFIVTVEPEATIQMIRLADRLMANGKEVTIWMYEFGDPADSQPSRRMNYAFKTKVEMLLA